MKLKNKKMILGTLGTIATVSLPLATVISCGKEEKVETHFLSKFTATVDSESFKKDGWGTQASSSKHILETVTKNGKKMQVLSHGFVDYLAHQVNIVDLTKDHKVFYMDLRELSLDDLGDYFVEKMSDIKMETKEYALKGNGGSETRTLRGSSGILLNISDNNFTRKYQTKDSDSGADYDTFAEKTYKLINDVEAIRGVVFSKWDWSYFDETKNEWGAAHWLSWTEDQDYPGFAANWKIRYK
ncbi:hypothetical protein [Mycoplasma todarodis]|uniref:hypothetical protein n=1 Tax=Mycoplasma todarodis TaxID=1937191 RepID=UPI003B374672